MRNYLVFILLLFALSSSAQSRKEKRIYYLDCSYSMKNNGWNDVKENLKNAISSIDDGETIVEVVCFAYDAYHNDAFIPEGYSICAFTNDSGKTKLKNFIDTRTLVPTTMTYHDVPLWDFINNNRIDKERDNYYFLMTDGKDQYYEIKEDLKKKYGLPEGKHNCDFLNKYNDTRLFDNLIKQHWSNISKNKNVFGFYVKLDEVEDTKRKELCSNTRYFWYMQTADIDVNTIQTDTTKISVLYNGSVQIHLKGKKNLHEVDPELNFEDRYYNLPHSYSNGVLTINPTIKPGVRAKDIPESEHIKIILSTKEKVTYNNKSQFNIIVDEELELVVKCKQNPISFTQENDETYNVRKSKSFILTTKGDLSKVERINVWFADSTNLSAKTNIKDNALIISPILKTDSTYYIDKFANQSVQPFKIYYSLESKDPFSYIDDSNSLMVKFEGKWEKWLRTFIEACDEPKSIFSIICSWFSSEIESSLGTVTYYPSFLWKEANTTNSNAKWNFVFTKDALGIAGTKVKLQFCDKAGIPLDTTQYKIYFNGQLSEDNSFEVSNKMTQLDVRVWMKPGSSSHTWWGKDKFEGNLKVVTYNDLIGINRCSISEGTLVLPWTITYEKDLNPIIVFLLWLLFYLFLLWLALKALLWWRANNSPKFPNDMWVHFRPGSGFNPAKDKNVHFEGKSIFKGTLENVLTIDRGNSVNTNVLSNLFVKELIILRTNCEIQSQGTWDRKFNGEIISVNCEFFNDNIDQIIMTPQKNSIVVTICYSKGCSIENEILELNIQDRSLNRKDTEAIAIPNSKLCIQGRIHTYDEVEP